MPSSIEVYDQFRIDIMAATTELEYKVFNEKKNWQKAQEHC
jgi:hypothetical protein